MKKLHFLSVFCVGILFPFGLQAQRVDSVATYILQETENNFQELKSCKFTAHILYDAATDEFGLTQCSQQYDVTLQFPDKFKVKSNGDKGQISFIYDGKNLTYYSFLKNFYAQRKAPANILATIDTMHNSLGYDFPAADFFYPSFLKNLLDKGVSLGYLGITQVQGKNCFHIAGKNEYMSFQFWISSDEIFVPVKVQIIYTSEEEPTRYEAYYDNWQFNEIFNSSIFHFNKPPQATEIKFHPKQN